jgi:hypothetical protein
LRDYGCGLCFDVTVGWTQNENAANKQGDKEGRRKKVNAE